MSDYGMDTIGLSEVRRKHFGKTITQNGNAFLYSGPSGEDVDRKME
jgi:hypothetical protein